MRVGEFWWFFYSGLFVIYIGIRFFYCEKFYRDFKNILVFESNWIIFLFYIVDLRLIKLIGEYLTKLIWTILIFHSFVGNSTWEVKDLIWKHFKNTLIHQNLSLETEYILITYISSTNRQIFLINIPISSRSLVSISYWLRSLFSPFSKLFFWKMSKQHWNCRSPYKIWVTFSL